jgi:hypothetical protein
MGVPVRAAATILIMALLLSACGKPHGGSAGSGSAAPAASSAAASAAPAAPPLSARALADKLLAPGAFDLSAQGYPPGSQALTCDNGGAGDDFDIRCRALLTDNDRGGRPAIVEIQLFDHDAEFIALDTPFKDHIADLNQNWSMATTPDITVKSNRTGVSAKLPAACHQALGRRNSPAYCDIMQSPRVFIVAGVAPVHASTHTLHMGGDSSSPDQADYDTDHASDLAMLVLTQVAGQQ